ncbi:hypothetical protein GCM10027398_16210 [Azotobacter salinestris]
MQLLRDLPGLQQDDARDVRHFQADRSGKHIAQGLAHNLLIRDLPAAHRAPDAVRQGFDVAVQGSTVDSDLGSKNGAGPTIPGRAELAGESVATEQWDHFS